MAVIEVRDLHKSYGDVRAVDGISFEVDHGEVYALLGHNGAGKSTTVEILEGHRTRTHGAVSVLGHDPADAARALRQRIGIVLQSAGVDHELTVREAVDLFGGCYPDPRPTGEVIDMVDLTPQTDERIGRLSGGQRRRVDLALGIVGRPDLLFLDEPTTGFDPAARRQSWELVESLCSGGTTVLLTTHYLDEAERLADRVGVMARGRMIAEGPPRELIGNAAHTTISFGLAGDVSIAALDGVLPSGARVEHGRVIVMSERPTADLHAITGWAVERGVELGSLTVSRPSLEDVYLELSQAAETPAETPADTTGGTP